MVFHLDNILSGSKLSIWFSGGPSGSDNAVGPGGLGGQDNLCDKYVLCYSRGSHDLFNVPFTLKWPQGQFSNKYPKVTFIWDYILT